MEDCFYTKKGIEKAAGMFTLKREIMKAFLDFDGKVFAEGSLNVKTKELIAVACAHITQCPYCIEGHTRRARKAGVTDVELAEAIFVAAAIRAGGAMAHSSIAMAALEG